MLAELALGQGADRRAAEHFRRALVEDPRSPYLRLRLAGLLIREGHPQRALALVIAAQRVSPGYARSYVLHARLVQRRSPANALRLLDRALKLDPRGRHAYLLQARIARRLGRPQAEEAAYRRLLKQHPDQADALYGLAKVAARLAATTTALKWLERLIAVQPFAAEPRLLQARLRRNADQNQQAAQVLLDALEATADDLTVAQELFRLWLAIKRPDRARDLAVLLSVHASAPYLTFVSGLYRQLGNDAKARALLRQALRQGPEYGPAVVQHAQWLLRQKGLDSAVAYLRQVGPKSRAYSSAQRALGEMLFDEGKPEAADQALRQALTIKPRSAALHETRGLLLARHRQVKPALAALERVRQIRRQPRDDPAHRYSVALAYEKGGQFVEAEKRARRLVQEDPDDAQSLNLLGYSLADRGLKLGEAVRVLQRAVRLDPLNPYILDSLGWAWHRQRRHGAAIRLLQLAVRIDGRLCEAWHHLGDALQADARRVAALRAYRRALACRPPLAKRRVLDGKIARLRSRGGTP
jgi:tetratricopeptide (TPR) repeat protein